MKIFYFTKLSDEVVKIEKEIENKFYDCFYNYKI